MTISTVLAAGKCPPEDTLSTSFFRFSALKTHDFYQNFKTVGVIVMSDPRRIEEKYTENDLQARHFVCFPGCSEHSSPPTKFYDNIPYYS